MSAEGRLLAAVLGTGPGAVLSHRSAAALWGFLRWGPGLIDVTTPGWAHRGRRGVAVHRSTTRRVLRAPRRRLRVRALAHLRDGRLVRVSTRVRRCRTSDLSHQFAGTFPAPERA